MEKTRRDGGGTSDLPADEAERVRVALVELHKTRYHQNTSRLARALGRSAPGTGAILKGKSQASLETAVRVAKLLNLTEYEVRTGQPPALKAASDPLEICLLYWEGRWSEKTIAAARVRFARGTRLNPPAIAGVLDELEAKADK